MILIMNQNSFYNLFDSKILYVEKTRCHKFQISETQTSVMIFFREKQNF
jgi:hypothetical protein